MSLTDEQSKLLAEPLDAKRVKQRQAGGNRPALSYLETHDVIRTANEIFGFGQWGHEIIDLHPISGIAVQKDGKTGICVGYVCTVRLTVEGCVPTSGIGYGDATEYQASGPVTAHELAVKEAESDALKRALKNYGDQFGLALYDKQARTSGHVASKPAAPQTAGTPQAGAVADAESPAAPAAPDQLAEYRLLCEAWGKLHEEFGVAESIALADGRDGDWVRRASERLKQNITDKTAEETGQQSVFEEQAEKAQAARRSKAAA